MKEKDFDHYLKKQIEKGIKKIFVYYIGLIDEESDKKYPILPTVENISLYDLHIKVKDRFEASIVGADCYNMISGGISDSKTSGGESAKQRVHPFSFSGHLIFCSSKLGQLSNRFTRSFFGNGGSGTFFGHWTSGLDEVIGLMKENKFSRDEVNFRQTMTLINRTRKILIYVNLKSKM